jgi:predicted ATPase
MLLVVDNCEQVLPAVPLIWDVLSAAPHVKVLATSRAALRLSAEHEYPVPPLAIPDLQPAGGPSSLAQYESVALFIARAQAAQPDFTLCDENVATVAAICRQLDGLPLAIEMAAARLKILTPQAIVARLNSHLKLLGGGGRDLPARRQTMRAAIEWSFDLLDTREQELFRRLPVFLPAVVRWK